MKYIPLPRSDKWWTEFEELKRTERNLWLTLRDESLSEKVRKKTYKLLAQVQSKLAGEETKVRIEYPEAVTRVNGTSGVVFALRQRGLIVLEEGEVYDQEEAEKYLASFGK